MRPMDPAAIHHHHDVFPDFAAGRHDLMDILAQLLGIKMRHDFVKDFGGAVLDGPNDTEQHAAGDTAPGAILHPRLPFAGLLAFNLTWAQGAEGEASTLGCTPPAGPEQGKPPEDGFIGIEQDDLPAACLVLESGQFQRPIRQGSGVGLQAPGRAIVAYRLFFNTPRTLSRPRWTPVSRAKTVANSRQLHCAWRAPCSRGS